MKSLKTNAYWSLTGKGMDSFGVNNHPVTEEIPTPSSNQILARVDAVTICASDVKMIQMGNDYPLFKYRNFKEHPARLGHELSLTVVQPGSNMEKLYPIGTRIGVQPDVYTNGKRRCIGVNVDGGMAEYILLEEEVFHSDNGNCAFQVDDKHSYAAVAQTEPFACVEAAFRQHSRQTFREKGKLLIYISKDIQLDYKLDYKFKAKEIDLYDPQKYFGTLVKSKDDLVDMKQIKNIIGQSYDDLIIIGNPDKFEMTKITECMAENGVLCWLPEHEAERYVEMDIAKVHYHKVNLIGTHTRRLSDALDTNKYRYDYQPGGDLLISGGGGAMGRIHVMRALQASNAPKRIIVINRTRSRLDTLKDDFGSLAKEKNIELICIPLKDTPNYKDIIWEIVGSSGVSDIIVSAPGIEPINQVVEFLANDGMLVLFSGTSYGNFGEIPLGLVASYSASITASSGSSVTDQLKVMEKMDKEEINPNTNIAAIAGMNALKEGVKAVKDRIYAGKIVVYPNLKDLPLLPLANLGQISKNIESQYKETGWSKECEDILFSCFEEKE